jgi:cell division protein FtsI/penicillin-binding protein 2
MRLVRLGEAHAVKPHGWFIAFAPAEHPRIALAVLVEHGGTGGESAAPVAREILARFFGIPSSQPGVSGPADVEPVEITDAR